MKLKLASKFKRVGFVSTRIAGTDGVSLEIRKWAEIIEGMGFGCYYIVGLTDRADHYPRQLSGGQQQRVGIARAIVTHPTLVVADEPTGDLDAGTSGQIQELLGRLNLELGVTMLMVTHDPAVAAIAGRRLRLEMGKITGAEETGEGGVGSGLQNS